MKKLAFLVLLTACASTQAVKPGPTSSSTPATDQGSNGSAVANTVTPATGTPLVAPAGTAPAGTATAQAGTPSAAVATKPPTASNWTGAKEGATPKAEGSAAVSPTPATQGTGTATPAPGASQLTNGPATGTAPVVLGFPVTASGPAPGNGGLPLPPGTLLPPDATPDRTASIDATKPVLPGPDVQTSFLSGKITSIDSDCHTLMLQDAAGPKEIPILGDTQVVLDGAKLRDLHKIHAGQQAKAYFGKNHEVTWLVLSSS